jgi:CubicO group peptidase (beta-lactamase class C family)
MTYVRAVALGVAVLAAGGSTQGARPQAVAAALDGYLRETVKEGEPGMALCVIQDGQTVYLKAAGLANVQSGAPLKTDTPIYLASLGKEFTTAAVLRLVEQKKLGLDDPIATRLPGLPSYMAPVTVRHLLTHTSGVPDYLDLPQEKVSGWTNQDVLDFLGRQTALSFPAGSKWSYSNSGFVLLAEMAGRVAGLPFARLLEQEFFRPLGMTSTYVRQKGRDEAEHAIGYEMKEGAWQISDYDNYTAGSGGIYASVEDMCRWGRALDEGSVLSRMTLIAAFTPAVTSSARPTPMGLGFQVEDVAAGPLQGTWYAAMFGIYRGFRGVDMKMKDRPWRYVVLSNSGRAPEPMQIPNWMAEP